MDGKKGSLFSTYMDIILDSNSDEMNITTYIIRSYIMLKNKCETIIIISIYVSSQLDWGLSKIFPQNNVLSYP